MVTRKLPTSQEVPVAALTTNTLPPLASPAEGTTANIFFHLRRVTYKNVSIFFFTM